MQRYILDANIIFQFFSGSPSVRKYFLSSDEKVINLVNLSEFAYHYSRKFGIKASGVRLNYLLTFVKPVNVDRELAEIAYKARVRYNLSLGDSFLVATAHKMGGIIVTSDHEVAERVSGDYKVDFVPLS
ncbi:MULTISPECIES: type II toxin-antitoxin system VapC family toxin [Metallosphaera]|uniref:PilT protein domain protein n=3 Tax=Metallosphaera TaxID=41980 RepID=A4YGY8_METS5|nr:MULTISPECIES: type II toxin-antitoxin system VapC family toxin [Metallosphaera]ABP95690.1 PilT protein domain protein [Metallosphaera sedula DSM 5348]AIM27674.1 PilT protein domain protein [Metallosphaera sedula]AKV74531.1 twitching motility protein PilT [Metallosphaera sedula]AKV76770.1 twitching motility protein PilT [Metallosphaera sedula]AKV79021.1 twitching motility protein PilT [Metallosphaera sedula]